MASWLSGIFDRSTGVAQKLATFTEARQTVLAENVANIDTPFYKARDLPLAEFQQMLTQAIEQGGRTGGSLRLRSTRSIEIGPDGRMTFKPAERPRNNILFHDNGNRSIETEMSEMVKNTLLHRIAVEILRKQYQGLESAISGRV
jgi:flagellar basal-body rod protein FlgB